MDKENIRALSLWQPWATMLVLGEKAVETRGYPTNVRGRVAIHAAKKKPIEVLPDLYSKADIWAAIYSGMSSDTYTILKLLESYGIEPAELPLGAVLGTVELYDCIPMERLYGSAYDNPKERALGDWRRGRYGWMLRDPVLFEKPIPASGSQGFWKFEMPKGAEKRG